MNIRSPKDLNREEIRQELWHYLTENPISLYMLAKEMGVSQVTLDKFLDPDSPREFGINVLLSVKKFLRTKYAERDLQQKEMLDGNKAK